MIDMLKETEIKLRASRETLDALRHHDLLKKRAKKAWERSELLNQYYDTPARDLAQAKVALRLRKDGEQFIQTLKSRGQSVAGLSERNEWDWYLSKSKLDLRKLTDKCWPSSLAELDKKTLQPIFTTDFTRERTDVAWGRGKAKARVEVALDLGKVIAGDQEEEICELELELREGTPEALLELAEALAADLPLMPCDISKAERGYRLFEPDSYSLSLALPQVSADLPLDEAFSRMAWHLLSSSQRLAEQYRFNGHWRLLQDWVAQLASLRALLGSLGQALPRASSRELRQDLDALLADWLPRVRAGQLDETVRQQAPQLFRLELDNTRWGLFSLRMSRWLLSRGWVEARNERGNRLGQLPLERWLPRFLQDEAIALLLRQCQQHPEELDDQLPRLARMLVWLRLARAVLVLPEVDRLYGELLKLSELAAQDEDEEVLAARSEQAVCVQRLPAWKALTR